MACVFVCVGARWVIGLLFGWCACRRVFVCGVCGCWRVLVGVVVWVVGVLCGVECCLCGWVMRLLVVVCRWGLMLVGGCLHLVACVSLGPCLGLVLLLVVWSCVFRVLCACLVGVGVLWCCGGGRVGRVLMWRKFLGCFLPMLVVCLRLAGPVLAACLRPG